MNKRKLQEYNNARNDGMEFALRIVEEKGVAALKEELKFRQCIPVPSAVTREMFLDAMLKFKNDTVDLITLVANCTLDREFEFNAEQLERFTTRFNLIIDCLNDKDNVLPQELLDNLREETGYNLVLRHMFNVK